MCPIAMTRKKIPATKAKFLADISPSGTLANDILAVDCPRELELPLAYVGVLP
jgi:hypothetical protein